MNPVTRGLLLAGTMWGHEKMNMLSILPVVLLVVFAVWFIWPLIADPIHKKRTMRVARKTEGLGDDLFRSLAKHAGPKHQLRESRS